MLRITKHRCRTWPNLLNRFAPNAWPPIVELALAMPTMMELPVTLPRVVARAAAARGSAPRWPTNATLVRLITRLHTIDKDTGNAKLSCPLASVQNGAGTSSVSSKCSAPDTLHSTSPSTPAPSSVSTAYRVVLVAGGIIQW